MLWASKFPEIWKYIYLKAVQYIRKKIKGILLTIGQCSLFKFFWSIIHKHLFTHIKNVILDEQHTFMPKHSSETNLLPFTEQIHAAINDNLQVDVIYTDFSKTCDKVNHNTILKRLLYCELSKANVTVVSIVLNIYISICYI